VSRRGKRGSWEAAETRETLEASGGRVEGHLREGEACRFDRDDGRQSGVDVRRFEWDERPSRYVGDRRLDSGDDRGTEERRAGSRYRGQDILRTSRTEHTWSAPKVLKVENMEWAPEDRYGRDEGPPRYEDSGRLDQSADPLQGGAARRFSDDDGGNERSRSKFESREVEMTGATAAGDHCAT